MLIDSNIIIYSLDDTSPKHHLAQNFLLHHQNQLVVAQQNIFETLRILTHRKFPNPFPVNEAIKALRAITEQATIIFPNLETHDLALELIQKYRVTGTEVFDAYLVATALNNGIEEIASDNTKHLQKYEEITVVNPFR
ncbi:MAG TPA: PIN domain-containing protein [Patescibacteria group bacterium]